MSEREDKVRDFMKDYGGKVNLDEQQQITLLYRVLEDVKTIRLHKNTIDRLINKHQLKLKEEKDLQAAIKQVNQFIIELEAEEEGAGHVDYLKRRGLYRMLYRNPKLKGKELPPDSPLGYLLRAGFIGVVVSSVVILFFLATTFFAAPFWLTAIATGLFISASAYLTGILYGVVSNLLEAHASLPYFLLGDESNQGSLLRTNNKVAQGIAWGVAGTFSLVVITVLLFTVSATATVFFVPMATFLLPLMMVGAVLIALGADLYARKKTQEYVKEWVAGDNPNSVGFNEYQVERLKFMSPTREERAAWHAISDRKPFGFTIVSIMGFIGLLALIVFSVNSVLLPPLLFVPLLSVIIPAAFTAMTALILALAGVYMHRHRDEQLDDRYRLEFGGKIEFNLYLEEDEEYVNELMEAYTIPAVVQNKLRPPEDKGYGIGLHLLSEEGADLEHAPGDFTQSLSNPFFH